MALWAILAAPLLMSNDLTSIRHEHKEILLNHNIIKVNQDVLGIQGMRVFRVRMSFSYLLLVDVKITLKNRMCF